MRACVGGLVAGGEGMCMSVGRTRVGLVDTGERGVWISLHDIPANAAWCSLNAHMATPASFLLKCIQKEHVCIHQHTRP